MTSTLFCCCLLALVQLAATPTGKSPVYVVVQTNKSQWEGVEGGDRKEADGCGGGNEHGGEEGGGGMTSNRLSFLCALLSGVKCTEHH